MTRYFTRLKMEHGAQQDAWYLFYTKRMSAEMGITNLVETRRTLCVKGVIPGNRNCPDARDAPNFR